MIISETTRSISIKVISIDYLQFKEILSLLLKSLNFGIGFFTNVFYFVFQKLIHFLFI